MREFTGLKEITEMLSIDNLDNVQLFIGENWISFEGLQNWFDADEKDLKNKLQELIEDWIIKEEDGLYKLVSTEEILTKFGIPQSKWESFIYSPGWKEWPEKNKLEEAIMNETGGVSFEKLALGGNYDIRPLYAKLVKLEEEGKIKFENGLYIANNNQEEVRKDLVEVLQSSGDKFKVELLVPKEWITFEKLSDLMKLDEDQLSKFLEELEEEGKIKLEGDLFKPVTSEDVLERYDIPKEKLTKMVSWENFPVLPEVLKIVVSYEPNWITFEDLQQEVNADIRDLDAKLQQLLNQGEIKYENGLFKPSETKTS